MYSFSTLTEFALLRESIKKDLVRTLGMEASLMFIALNEAVNNAIVHGNDSDPGKKVYLTVDGFSDEVKVIIRDEGEGYFIGEHGGEEDLFRERGRGLQIIKHCVDQHYFNAQRNEIILIKKRPVV